MADDETKDVIIDSNDGGIFTESEIIIEVPEDLKSGYGYHYGAIGYGYHL